MGASVIAHERLGLLDALAVLDGDGPIAVEGWDLNCSEVQHGTAGWTKHRGTEKRLRISKGHGLVCGPQNARKLSSGATARAGDACNNEASSTHCFGGHDARRRRQQQVGIGQPGKNGGDQRFVDIAASPSKNRAGLTRKRPDRSWQRGQPGPYQTRNGPLFPKCHCQPIVPHSVR